MFLNCCLCQALGQARAARKASVVPPASGTEADGAVGPSHGEAALGPSRGDMLVPLQAGAAAATAAGHGLSRAAAPPTGGVSAAAGLPLGMPDAEGGSGHAGAVAPSTSAGNVGSFGGAPMGAGGAAPQAPLDSTTAETCRDLMTEARGLRDEVAPLETRLGLVVVAKHWTPESVSALGDDSEGLSTLRDLFARIKANSDGRDYMTTVDPRCSRIFETAASKAVLGGLRPFMFRAILSKLAVFPRGQAPGPG